MCIALLSTAHPSYKLILINNRDEYLNRPTAVAQWWPEPHSSVLGGRDLLRDVHGTWLGVTKQGKIAVLTNFREATAPPPTAISRGAITRKWLSQDVGTTEEFVAKVVDTGIARDAGGFSLVCGRLDERLAVISNRAEDQSQVPWICGPLVQTVGLSNTTFLDRSWKKVTEGEEMMLDIIRESMNDGADEDVLIERFLKLLSRDTLTRMKEGVDSGLATHVTELRNTIFVPALGRKDVSGLRADEYAAARTTEKAEVFTGQENSRHEQLGTSGLYGTQKQTVILVSHDMDVRFFERTLYDQDSNAVSAGSGDIDIRFKAQQ